MQTRYEAHLISKLNRALRGLDHVTKYVVPTPKLLIFNVVKCSRVFLFDFCMFGRECSEYMQGNILWFWHWNICSHLLIFFSWTYRQIQINEQINASDLQTEVITFTRKVILQIFFWSLNPNVYWQLNSIFFFCSGANQWIDLDSFVMTLLD